MEFKRLEKGCSVYAARTALLDILAAHAADEEKVEIDGVVVGFTMEAFRLHPMLDRELDLHDCGTAGCIGGHLRFLKHPHETREDHVMLGVSFKEYEGLCYIDTGAAWGYQSDAGSDEYVTFEDATAEKALAATRRLFAAYPVQA